MSCSPLKLNAILIPWPQKCMCWLRRWLFGHMKHGQQRPVWNGGAVLCASLTLILTILWLWHKSSPAVRAWRSTMSNQKKWKRLTMIPSMNALHGWKQTCLGINMDKESSSWTIFVSWKLFCIVNTHHDHHASIVPTISNLMGFGWVKACIRSSSCFPHQTLGAISAWFDPWPQAWDEFKVEMPTWKRAWCWPSVDILKWTEGYLTRVWFHSKTGK